MLIRWKSGYVAYWVRGLYYLAIGVAVALVGVTASVRWLGGYDTVRHGLSIVAAILVILNLPFALRRRRILRFGPQARWLKAHWLFAGAGLTLLLTHSALDPGTWSGWMAFLLAVTMAASGLLVHFTRRYARRYLLRAHLILALLLVAGLVTHGLIKLDHPEFPLDTPTEKREVVHNVPCADCHAVRNAYDQYRCATCHVHDTDEIRLEHELHGVTETERCLDCHRAKIEGATYFTGAGFYVHRNVFVFDD